MSNELPPMLWYLLLVITVIALSALIFAHLRRMKALEILKIYAEKGVEPPAPIANPLIEQISDTPAVAAQTSPRAAFLAGFIGFLFMACMLGGVAWWCFDASGPKYVLYPVVAFGMFFGVGAFGYLIAALFTRDK